MAAVDPPIYLTGPTAVGKSTLAMELAESLHGSILSADSMQVYRGMDIGTAKPSTADRARIRHHLIDLVDPDQSFDVQRYVTAAQAALKGEQNGGKISLFAGGTGLYLKALREGLDATPPSDPVLRERLEKMALEDLLAELREKDPLRHDQIDRKNPRRVIRAIEIIRLTGRPVSQQRRSWQHDTASELPPLIVLTRSPKNLRRRIEHRVDAMITAGLVAETEHLLKRGLGQNPTAQQALGYRQVSDYLAGTSSLPDTIALIKTKTWQFARRQLTWFRKQPQTVWLDLDELPASEHLKAIQSAIHAEPQNETAIQPISTIDLGH